MLHNLATDHRTIRLGGCFSKDRLGGAVVPADATVSTSSMRRVLQYEPHDLTISVEAGMPFRELEKLLASNRQMLPLDPPWPESTVGGVVAANLSGPRRRLYGTARDMIIGMTFATLEGKLIRSGGKVVKNVAGLDMAKLMVGSFGTLAAIAIVNFKVFPMPEGSRTFVMNFTTAAEAFAERDRILRSVLTAVCDRHCELARRIPVAGARGRESGGARSCSRATCLARRSAMIPFGRKSEISRPVFWLSILTAAWFRSRRSSRKWRRRWRSSMYRDCARRQWRDLRALRGKSSADCLERRFRDDGKGEELCSIRNDCLNRGRLYGRI